MDGCPDRNDVPQVQELLSNGPQHHVCPQPQPGGEAESRKNGCCHSAGRTGGQEDGRDGQEADVTSVQLPMHLGPSPWPCRERPAPPTMASQGTTPAASCPRDTFRRRYDGRSRKDWRCQDHLPSRRTGIGWRGSTRQNIKGQSSIFSFECELISLTLGKLAPQRSMEGQQT